MMSKKLEENVSIAIELIDSRIVELEEKLNAMRKLKQLVQCASIDNMAMERHEAVDMVVKALIGGYFR